MSSTVISIEHLSKVYRLGQIGTGTFAHDLTVWWAKVRGKPNPLARIDAYEHGHRDGEELWALRDVSFAVQQGEVLGIIGRNGAGKSTLLKILSRVTAPTSGMIKVRGRIASLLEVGTGFHPELTGRENIYLNGAILGMSRQEIDKKFDEIVDFSEIEKFIDTPVRRYSSGMYVRLAFAVAAHLEPEILVVDEVLAVGDAAFQRKCLGKMGDVAKEGRTVLFVSHNLPTLSRLCPDAIWLDQGVIACSGDSRSVVKAYLTSSESVTGERRWDDVATAPGDEFVRAVFVKILDVGHRLNLALHQDEPFIISIAYRVLKPMMTANVGFELRSDDGTVVFWSFDADDPAWTGKGRQPGRFVADCFIPPHFLNEGLYYITLLAGIPHVRMCFKADDVIRFELKSPISEGPSARMGARRAGVVTPDLNWVVKPWA